MTHFALPGTITLFGTPFDRVVMTAGLLAFPVTFIATDLVDEYYGKPGIHFLAWLGVAIGVPVGLASAVPGAAFGATSWVIVGSLGRTSPGSARTWRSFTVCAASSASATSGCARPTLGSQFFYAFLVLSVAFYVPSVMTIQRVLAARCSTTSGCSSPAGSRR